MMKQREQSSPDIVLLFVVFLLVVFGLVMIYSASAVDSGFKYLVRQSIWAVLGFLGMIVFMNFDYQRYRRLSGWVLLLSIGALGAVMLFADPIKGSKRWIDLGFFRIQPSEIAKFALVIFMAHYLAIRVEELRSKPTAVIPPLVITSLVCGLVVIEDLGTGVTMGGTVFVMLFTVGVSVYLLGGLVLLTIPPGLYFILSPQYAYRLRRIMAFIDPFKDPLGAGFHIIQSLFSLGSGKVFGVGLGQGRMKYSYLPEPNTDFIFAVVGEELGLLGTGLLLLLFFTLAWRGLQIALKCEDLFGSLLAVGLTAMITLQAMVNFAVVSGSMPVTGITLPFISYGGSSLCIMLAAVGILLNISRQIKDL